MDSDDTLKLVLLLVGLLLVLPVLSMGLIFPFMGGMMGFPMGSQVGGMFVLGLGWLIPLGILLLVGFAIYRLVQGGESRDPAMEALREAYASGEIDDDEFERRRSKLREE